MIYFELFYVFAYIGLFTFGGGYSMIPLISEEVTKRNWLSSADEISNFIAISESTPGPFAINIATFVGAETGGILGSICATIGVVLPSFIIILLVAALLSKVLKRKRVQGALNGIRPVVVSLILSTAIFFLIRVVFSLSGNITINNHDIVFDRLSFGILVLLLFIMYVYKKNTKKSLSPIIILLLSGLFGLLFLFV